MESYISLNPYSPVGMKAEEVSDDPKTRPPAPDLPELTYQILNADHLFLKDASHVLKGNLSQRSQKQTFIITGLTEQPAINVSYGPMSVEQSIPPELVNTDPSVRAFILARQVRSSAPIIRLLFYATSKTDLIKDVPDQVRPGQNEAGYICVTAHAFWALLEVRGTCSIPANGGFCLAQLKPEPAWFSPGGARSSREQRGDSRGTVVELYYQTRPSPTSQCVAQDSNQWKGANQAFGPNMKKIGNVSLLRSPPGNPTFMRLRLGGTVIVQTSSKPLKNADTATFYVFLSSTSPVVHFILRGLLEVLQLDFETQEQNDQLESQMITFRLELPANMIQDEGTMRIYTVQRDYVGIVPFIMNTELLNTAVLTGKKVSVPVKVLGVEADGSVSDITNSSRCRSADEDTLKVSERCESVYMNGEETRGRVRMMVNFTYSYLSAQLEVSVWMPHFPLQIDMSDPELSQIKGWRVPVFGAKRQRVRETSWESEEEDEKKGRGCMLQYQHSLVRVLTAFTAGDPDSSGSSPVYFLGPEWLVDVTGLVRYSLKVGDTSIARLQSGTVLSGRAAGVTAVQVMSPLSDAVLAERMVRVLDDKVSITELGVQLVSGLSLNLQLSPGSNRAIVATTTTQDTMHNPKQEAVVACWVKFSDGSQTPLDLFDPSGYTLTVSSLDKKVVLVRKVPGHVVVAEAEGQGLLLRAELAICEACQKSKRKSKLAVGAGTVRVKFLSAEQPATESGRTQPGIRGVTDYACKRQSEGPYPPSELDLMRTFGFFTDLEICIYSLVGVSCLAIIAILLNCATHNAKSRSKKSPVQCHGPHEHKHHWVRLGTAAEQSRAVPIVTTQVPSTAAEMPSSMEMQKPMERPTVMEMPRAREMPVVPCEERTATLGRRSSTLPHRPDPLAVRSATLLPRPIRNDPLHSPTSKRNQVQFTTFTTLDIKHLAALKRNGQDLNWASQATGGVNHAMGTSQAIVANQGGSCSLVAAAGQAGLCSQVKAASQAGLCSQVGPANQVGVHFQIGGCTQAGDCVESKRFLPEAPWPVVKPVAQV
uniref:Uncharacterized protein n=1 Tax=Pygocentrus nattereri TaxID=42514 RepID=A0AAR2KBB5_PYGNA